MILTVINWSFEQMVWTTFNMPISQIHLPVRLEPAESCLERGYVLVSYLDVSGELVTRSACRYQTLTFTLKLALSQDAVSMRRFE